MKPIFNSTDGLIPVIIQNALTAKVLMLGYMNEEALAKTKTEGRVTFFSRSKQRLWTKGETSGNFLKVVDIKLDCDSDALLISAIPSGPTCHTGSETCFFDSSAKGFLYALEQKIEDRIQSGERGSYTSELMEKGIGKVAQKVGEEAVEVVIEAMGNDEDLFKNEVADLAYHLLVLLKAKGITLEEIEQVLRNRANG